MGAQSSCSNPIRSLPVTKDLADKLAGEASHCHPPTIMYCISLLSLSGSLVSGKPLCPVLVPLP